MIYTFKVCFEGDVRRFSFQDNQPSYNDLVGKLSELFNLHQSFVITYLDEVGDNITISSDEELEEAFLFLQETQQQILRLSVILKSNFNQFINNNQSNNNSNNQNTNNNNNNSFKFNSNFNNNNSNNNNCANGLDTLFVSLLSNQFVQQMIPQVINNLATNPALMTSIIQSTSTALRSNNNTNQNNNNSNHNNSNTHYNHGSNFHTSLDALAIINSPNTVAANSSNQPISLVSAPVSSSNSLTAPSSNSNSPSSQRNSVNLSNPPTTQLQTSSSSTSSNDSSSPSTSPSSSTYSSLDATSFAELSNSPTKDSPLASALAQNENTATTTTSNNTSNNSNNNTTSSRKSNPISLVPKIFNHIPFPFSGRSTTIEKKEETIIIQVPSTTPTNVTYNPQQPYIHHQSVYPPQQQPPQQQYSPNIDPLTQAQMQTNQHQQPPQLYYPPTSPYQPIPNSPQQTHTQPQSSPIQNYHHQQPISLIQQQQQQQNPQFLNPLPPLPPTQQNLTISQEKVSILVDALRISEQRAKEMLDKHNGNIEEAMIMETETS